MNFTEQEIILENGTALLKPMILEDIGSYKDIAFDEGVNRFISEPIRTPEILVENVSKALKERLSGLSYPFTITDKKSKRTAGSTRYMNISAKDKRLEIGWTWLGADFRGTGLNKACKFLLLSYAFEQLKYNRVEFKTDLLNVISQRAMEKIGAKKEGILRQHGLIENKRFRDTVYYSILAEEWDGIKESIFKEFI